MSRDGSTKGLSSGLALMLAYPESSIPVTVCGRLEQIQALLHPVDPETGEELPPLIDIATARRLLGEVARG